ncbi:hypothetical protein B296_00002369 [Ensete ventricosum]|uniref:Uncharacterized protein n=1 Tax=Ensete ventricosum TaxID=4639 RepID=A0A427B3D6_ENSVE|nr:hypothetical protein B296_00002369 [Ensete ventricosum]
MSTDLDLTGTTGKEPSKIVISEQCFSTLELVVEAGTLKDLDPEKLKNEIKRWAKAVVAYAHQLSFSAICNDDSVNETR